MDQRNGEIVVEIATAQGPNTQAQFSIFSGRLNTLFFK